MTYLISVFSVYTKLETVSKNIGENSPPIFRGNTTDIGDIPIIIIKLYYCITSSLSAFVSCILGELSFFGLPRRLVEVIRSRSFIR